MSDETLDSGAGAESGRKRTRMVRPYPMHTLEDALEVATKIQEVNAGFPFDRKLLAKALGTTPSSSGYTMKLNSSSRYGLTLGGYSDELIELTPLGQSIVAPRDGDEQTRAQVEAVMQPEVFARFYRMLDGKQLPEDTYARNLLQRELGIHPELAAECLEVIKANGLLVGLIVKEGGSLMVRLPRETTGARPVEAVLQSGPPAAPQPHQEPAEHTERREEAASPGESKVFIGHSGDGSAFQVVRSVLEQFDIPYATADESSNGAGPLPSRVAEVMRSCTAGILVFDGEQAGSAGHTVPGLLQRMLYQLGAASVLYGDRVVLVTQRGLEPELGLSVAHTVTFDKDDPGGSGLALLRELHRSGIIRIAL